MRNLEKKIDLLMNVVLAEYPEEEKAAKYNLRRFLAESQSVSDTPRTVEQEVKAVLAEIGIRCNLCGHGYLVKAICMVIDRPELSKRITKELYPEGARSFGVSAARFERGIRHAIECAWDYPNLESFEKYFGNTVCPSKGRPTVGHFICQLASCVRDKEVN